MNEEHPGNSGFDISKIHLLQRSKTAFDGSLHKSSPQVELHNKSNKAQEFLLKGHPLHILCYL